MGRTGVYGYLCYGWETLGIGKGTTQGNRNKVFGRAQRITGINERENLEMVYELGAREAQTGVFKQFEGGCSIEWILSNPWFFKGLFGSWASAANGSLYDHTFTKANSFSSSSMQIETGFQGENGNVYRSMLGAVFNSVSLTYSVNDVVKVRGDILFTGSSTLSSGQATAPSDSFVPMDYSMVAVKYPATSGALAEVQSMELTINNNALVVYGLGSAFAQSQTPQQFEVTGRMDITMKDSTFIDKLRSHDTSGLAIVITQSSSNYITITGIDTWFDEHSFDLEANALVVEGVPFKFRDAKVVATNSTATVA